MSAIKIIIVEDEKPARDLIRAYLEGYPGVEIIGEFENGFDGLKAINEMKPDAIFLDVQMPKLNGFEMLEVLEHTPDVIFTTAYDKYAISAFEQNAVDYLLKPFSKERLIESLRKLEFRVANRPTGNDIEKIRLHFAESDEKIHRVVIKKSGKIIVISTDDIHYLEAQDDYVMLYHTEGKALKQQTMKFYEENLPEKDFVRIHRSYIVSVSEINKIEPYGKDNHVAVLKSGEKLPVSRTGYKLLKNELNF